MSTVQSVPTVPIAAAPTVVVKRGGFLSALAYGFFGTVIAVVVSGSLLAFSCVKLVDRRLDEVSRMATEVVELLPEWQKALPPALADALNDRRDLGYREHVDVHVKVLGTDLVRDNTYSIVEVTNNGDQAITLMSLRIVFENEGGVPVREFTTYAATPLAIDSEWRGPLLPGSSRRFTVGSCRGHDSDLKASVEITELRVWSRDAADNPMLVKGPTGDTQPVDRLVVGSPAPATESSVAASELD